MSPTPFADLNDVLSTWIAGVQEALGAQFVGAYLQGSFAMQAGDEHSDVDFVVAVEGPLEDEAVRALQALHGRIHDLPCPWAQHLEGSYFPRDVLRDCEACGQDLWYLDNGARALIRSPHCNTVVVRQTVREHGIRLAGPDVRTLLDPIPVSRLRADIHDTMNTWGREILDEPDPYANRFYQGFIAQSYCRMWCSLTTGRLGSKRRGVQWAQERLDASWGDFLDRTWATRPDPATSVRTPADPRDFARTLELVQLVIDRCAGRDARE